MTKNRNVIYIDKTNFKEDDVTGISIIVAPRQDEDVRLSYHSTTDRKSVSFIILFTGILTASIILGNFLIIIVIWIQISFIDPHSEARQEPSDHWNNFLLVHYGLVYPNLPGGPENELISTTMY